MFCNTTLRYHGPLEKVSEDVRLLRWPCCMLLLWFLSHFSPRPQETKLELYLTDRKNSRGNLQRSDNNINVNGTPNSVTPASLTSLLKLTGMRSTDCLNHCRVEDQDLHNLSKNGAITIFCYLKLQSLGQEGLYSLVLTVFYFFDN